MCAHRDHKFRLTITVGNDKPHDLVVQAKGIADAVAKADGWVVKHHGPNANFHVATHRMGYQDVEMALEHGAILPSY